jgi:A/G-specific adenine glycosylase
VSPCQQIVQIREFFVEHIVFFRPDEHDVCCQAGRTSNFRSELSDPIVRADFFAIRDSERKESARDLAIDVHAGDDQRSEKVSFPAFIDPEVWFEHRRIENLLVADPSLFQDFRLKVKPDEIVRLFSLNNDLRPLFIDGDGQFCFLREKDRVGSIDKFESLIPQKLSEGFSLGVLDGYCVRVHRWGRMKQIFSEITEFRAELGAWFERHGRRLPWRATNDPYAILVSELMLQQTQVATVLGYYQRWFECFPTVRDLASADESEVLHAWQGLGYYNRARNLHKCAKIIVGERSEEFPSAVDELTKLPGIGRYTAGAVASFAFNLPAPIVEANIERALSRLLNLKEPVDQPHGRRIIWDFASRYVQGPDPRLLNSALMELGATICSPRKPLCVICPVRSFCAATDPESLPRKRARQKVEKKTEFHFLALKEGRILLQQNLGKRWHGLWSLPALAPGSESSQPVDLNLPFLSLSYPITRFVVELNVYVCEPPAILDAGQEWYKLDAIGSIPMPSPHRRAIQMAAAKGRIGGPANCELERLPAGTKDNPRTRTRTSSSTIGEREGWERRKRAPAER